MLLRMNPVLGSIVLIASVTLFQCTEVSAAAGQDATVWTARCDKNNVITYERLETGAVKRAMDYLHSDKFQSLRSRREKRSLQDHVEFDEPDNLEHLARRDAESLANNRTRVERAYHKVGVAEILPVLQYDAREVTDEASRVKYINEKILYTIAYWRAFNEKVIYARPWKNWRRAVVRLVAIIIALDRCATPYLDPSVSGAENIRRVGQYWKSPPAEFPSKTYHTVAIMTDLISNTDRGYPFDIGHDGGANAVIVWDDQSFFPVDKRATVEPFVHFTNTLWSWSLRDTERPEYMKFIPEFEILPGKLYSPEEQCYIRGYTSLERLCPILPGKLYSPEEQCYIRGYTSLERLCPEYSTDCKIYCLNSGWFKSCGSIGHGLEGTPCVNGKVG